MSRRIPCIELSRTQILTFRRRVGSLDERLPPGAKSLRIAAWAGLQDSMPRAALLSINARVRGTNSSAWEHPSLVQLWGPRFSNYVVAAKDLPVFSLGRMPGDDRRRARAHDTASRLHALLEGRRMLAAEAESARWVCGRTCFDMQRRQARFSSAGTAHANLTCGPGRRMISNRTRLGWNSRAGIFTSLVHRRPRHSRIGRA